MKILREWVRNRVGTFEALFVVRCVQWPLRALTRPLLRWMRRDPSLVVFGAAANRFADNPAYAFLAASADNRLTCVWISGSRAVVERLRARGLRAERRWSVRGVRSVMRAGWIVFGWHLSDVNLWLGDGARTFNVWHGVGVKRIQRARVVGPGARLYQASEGSLLARVFADDRHVPDLVLSTSPGMTPVLSEAFAVPHGRCIEAGYPRNDHLLLREEPPRVCCDPDVRARLRDTTVVGYFPTFRDGSSSIPGGEPAIADLAEIVAAQGATLLFKSHEVSTLRPDGRDALVVLDPEADLNAYLDLCDVLVTDYSSVASDYLLLGRPIVLFVPDIADYTTARGFALDPVRYLPGIVTTTRDELYDALADLSSLGPPSRLDELTEFYWGRPAPAADRIVKVLAADAAPSA